MASALQSGEGTHLHGVFGYSVNTQFFKQILIADTPSRSSILFCAVDERQDPVHRHRQVPFQKHRVQ